MRHLSYLSIGTSVLTLSFTAVLGVFTSMPAHSSSDSAADRTFDLICTTTSDPVEGTLADGSPIVPAEIGEVRRYSMDLDGMRYAIDGTVSRLHAINGDSVIKSDPNAIRSFGGTVHMQSDWRLNLATGESIRRNRFFADSQGSRVTGRSEWHQQCKRAPFSGIPQK